MLVHSDGGSYKPLNWMSPPCSLKIGEPGEEAHAAGVTQVWTVQNAKSDDRLVVHLHQVIHDVSHDLGVDPGLVKDGVEAHLQELLAEHVHTLGSGFTLVRREYPTAIGPVDLLVRDAAGGSVAVEVKRRGEIDGVEQTDPLPRAAEPRPAAAAVSGVFAAQEIKPQAKVLATDRGIPASPSTTTPCGVTTRASTASSERVIAPACMIATRARIGAWHRGGSGPSSAPG